MRTRLLVAALVAAAVLLDEAGSSQAASVALVLGVPASAGAALLAFGEALDESTLLTWLRTALAALVLGLVFAATTSASLEAGALVGCLVVLALDGLLRLEPEQPRHLAQLAREMGARR